MLGVLSRWALVSPLYSIYLVLFTIVGHEVRIVLENKKKADAIIQAREKTVITTYFDALILCKADGTVGQGVFW